jgi:hypothetical protein
VTVRSAIAGRAPAVAVMAVGAVVVIVGSLLPWLRTGARRRHSYDLFELVERLGFASTGPVATALRWWPLVPLLAVSAVVAAWWGWPRAGGVVGVVAALYAGAIALAVSLAPSGRAIDALAGAPVTFLGAGALLGGSVAAIVTGFRRAVRR